MWTHSGTLVLGALCIFVVGCGSSAPPKTAADAHCPEGQSFDGQFCQVNQSVATAEQPRPAPAATEPRENTNGSSDDSSAEVEPARDNQGPANADEMIADSQVSTAAEQAAETDVIAQPPLPATAVDYAMAAQAAPVMQYLASSHLKPGARPLGNPFAAQFAPGQGLTKKVQLTAGKCYTIVGIGLPPVTNVDIYVIDPDSNTILVKDDTTGPQAVLGSRDSCYSPNQTGSFSLLLVVTEGQGIAAAQVFQK